MTRPSLRTLALCSTGALLLACADDPTAPAHSGLDTDLLTPAVAAMLDSRGYFPRQEPEPGYVTPRSRKTADSLAMRYVETMIESQRTVWELQHGGPIDEDELRPCGAAPYASSAYEVSLMTPSQPLRSEAVGRYQVFLCDRAGEAKVHVIVPVEPYLLLPTPEAQLGRIGAVGVRIEQGLEPLISAERAARIAAGRTGRRVAGVPELVSARFNGFPARWRVPLESPVAVIGERTAEADTLSFVMVGRDSDDASLHFDSHALRPLLRATLAARTDSLDNEGVDPLALFTIRLGMPRSVEPFYRPWPP